jgi:hypothetical protein
MLLKQLVRRRRPCLPDLPPLAGTPTQLSFPSAHASTSFAGARCYSRLGLPAAPLYGLAAGLSLSRLYLGVHYPSDVLGGALLGMAVANFAPGMAVAGRASRGDVAGCVRGMAVVGCAPGAEAGRLVREASR